MLVRPKIIDIPEEWGILRDIRNPKNLYKEFTYGKTFDETYDYTTFFCGAFKIGDKAVLIGPPLLNIKEFIKSNITITDGSNKLTFNSIEQDRCELTVIDINSDTTELNFYYNESLTLTITLEPIDSKYNDKSVVFTMQMNETIDSIKTWIKYYRDVFSINGFVIFDNNSTNYSLKELNEGLEDLKVNYEIVKWPLSHGPIGPPWDSEYGRICAFQYMKYKYGFNAKCVVNLDIDEFLVCDNTLDEVSESMIEQGIDTISVQSKNISRYTENQSDEYSIKNYYYYHANDNSIGGERSSMVKWITVPKLSRNYCWTTHYIHSPNSTFAEEIYYAHMWIFCSPNHLMNNSGTTVKDERFIIHENGYKEDIELKKNLSKIDNKVFLFKTEEKI